MIPYVPPENEEDLYLEYFARQAEQTGFGFVGDPYQRGAGLGALFRGLLKTVTPFAKSALKSVGKAALETGLAVAGDAIEGKDLGQSVRTHVKRGAVKEIRKAQNRLGRSSQKGEGLGHRPAQNKRWNPYARPRRD